MTDLPREGIARKKQIRRVIYVALVCTLLAGMTWALSRLNPAAPSVERASVWVGEAERGPMVIDLT